MAIETDTVTLPAYWACALVNGDVSGMEDSEIAAMERHIATVLEPFGWHVSDVARDAETGEPCEPYFTWQFALYGGDAQGGDVLDYVVFRDKPKRARRKA